MREGYPVMERTFGENWRNAVLGIALTIAVVGGGLAAALWLARRRRSAPDHRDLRDIDRAAAKAAFAIHQIIAPQTVKGFAEAGELSLRDRKIVALAPALQRLGVVEPKGLAIFP